jgi:hypothetical protein
LFESGSLGNLHTPVPFTGDLFAAIQGYGMRLNLENGSKTILTATLQSSSREREGERVGKFYFINTKAMFVSYGIWGTRDGYAQHLKEFEKSAQTIILQNRSEVNLNYIFTNYISEKSNVTMADGSTLTPKFITSGSIDEVRVDENSNSVIFRINGSSANDFFYT